MTAHYEEIMELWKEGKFFDAIKYFSRWMSEGLVTEDESKSFKKELARFWELVEVECEENPEVMFTLYEMLRNARDWDDKTLCKELRISEEALEDIKIGLNQGLSQWDLRCCMNSSRKWLCSLSESF